MMPAPTPRLTWYRAILALALPLALAGGALAASKDQIWVIYETELGWLRVGSQSGFEEPETLANEVWGGSATGPLRKTLVRGGFESREAAVKAVCEDLSRVRLKHYPERDPRWVVNAIYQDREYNLRVAYGSGPRYWEYDELLTLSEHGITPRVTFQSQYLVHGYKRDTAIGPEECDDWMCIPNEPVDDGFWVGDMPGYYQHYYCDLWDGPFRDSFALAKAMKRLGCETVDLYPDDLRYRVDAEKIPDDPLDFGIAATPVQPLVDDPRMRDWVIYATELDWVRIGTRTEFEEPRLRRDEIWAGTEKTPIPKVLVAEGFGSYDEAVHTFCQKLTGVKWWHVRNNRPSLVILGTYDKKEYRLQLARDPNVLVAKGRGYDHNAERVLLAGQGITPITYFAPQYAAHSIRMSTLSGPRETDYWMLTFKKPEGGATTVSDGVGGWFIHEVEESSGLLEDSFALARELKPRGVERVVMGEGGPDVRLDWIPDDPRDYGGHAPKSEPTITKIDPVKAKQGDKLYVTIYGQDIKYGADVSLGPGVSVRDLTYFGRDPTPDSKDKRWLLTLSIAGDAAPGARTVALENFDGGQTSKGGLFTIAGVLTEMCAFPELPDTPGNAEATAARARQQKAVQELKAAREELRTIEIDLSKAKEVASREGGLLDEGPQLKVAVLEGNRRECHEQKIERAAAAIRKAEEDWLKALRGPGGGLPYARRAQLIAKCRERADCVRDRMFDRVKDLQRIDRALILAINPEVGTRYQQYATARNDLDHLLKFWGVLGNMQVVEAERGRRRAARRGQGSEDAQRALWATHVERAEWAVQAAELKTVAALEGQRHYYSALKAIRANDKKTPWMDGIVGDAAQAVAVGTQYLMGSFSSAWTGFVDGLKLMAPDALMDWAGIESLAQKVDGQILQLRKNNDKKLEYVRSLRGYDVGAMRALRGGLSSPDQAAFVSEGYSLLMADRNVHEMTDGGVFRIAGAVDATRTERLETEYLAALHHARLTVRDMQTSLNIEMGRDPTTGHLSLKMLLDPLQIAYVVKADEKGLLATKRLFIDGKRAQVENEMAQLLPRWRRAEFDFERIGELLPRNFAHHQDLIWNNEDYCQFYIRTLMLDHTDAMDGAEQRREQAVDPALKRQLDALIRANRWRLQLTLRPYLARSLQLQAQTKIICRDWVGAATAVEQAVKINPDLAKVIDVEAVKDSLLWEGVRQTGIDVFHQLGNQAFMAALTAQIMGVIGPATAAEQISFGEFVWGQVNPFAKVLTSEGAANVVQNAVEQIAQEGVGKQIKTRVGIDQQYADFAANIIVGAASKWTQRGVQYVSESLLYGTARDLDDASERAKQKRPDQDPDVEEARERKALQEQLADLAVIADAEDQQQKAAAEHRQAVRKSGATSQEAEGARQRVLDAAADVDGRTRPLTEARVRKCLGQYEARAGGGFSLKDAIRLFRRLPLTKLRQLKREGKLPVELERQVDAVRVQMMDSFQQEVSRRAGGDVICLVMTGAAANPDGAEYVQKMLDSDFDFTFLVRADLPEDRRKQIEALYQDLVRAASGRDPMELADSTGFSDLLNAKYGLEDFADLTQANVTNPERYLNLGAIEFILFMNKAGGRVKGFDKKTGTWKTLSLEANEQVFGHMKFEEWMGADIALEQYRFRESHREHRGEDVFGFLRDQGKYTVRAALGRLVADPEACARLNALKPQEAIDAGGLHAAIIKVAQEFEGRLFTADQIATLRQCNELKKGVRPEEVFGATSRSAVNRAIAEHNQKVSALFDQVLPATMTAQQSAVAQYETASSTQETRDKAYKIVLAQAWALSRLKPEQLEYVGGLGTDAKRFTSSDTALELARTYQGFPDPPHLDR